MPELPEVAFARDCLERWLVGHELARAEVDAGRVSRGIDRARFADLARGVFTSVTRHGKWLALRSTAPAWVLGHLGMTGKYELQLPEQPPVRWSRARFVRADGAVVHYSDPRQFGRLLLHGEPEVRHVAPLAELGPDAWEPRVDARALGKRLAHGKRSIKDVLMDQTVLAGLGNIQVTDALFLARIRPTRRASSLSASEVARLSRAIRTSLRRTIKMNSGDKIVYVEESQRRVNPFFIYGKSGLPCPRCRAILRKITIAARTTAYCVQCQT